MTERLDDIANRMVAEGKGILAADESSGTIKKRFDSINLDSTDDNRRDYREMLFRSDGMKDYVSGVILFDETLRQNAADGTPLVELVSGAGAVPGIKVDTGAKPLAGHPGETVTEGLDGLRERLAEYHSLGARFAKWRAVIAIGDGRPSWTCIKANCHALARYAALCQEAGIVPIVEPEVMMDGPDANHDIDTCFEVSVRTQNRLYDELYEAGVDLEGTVLKPNMVVPGQHCTKKASVEEVAEKTVRCLRATVPPAVPGIAFLSGGQSGIDATAHLSAMNAMYDNLPWKLTFSYGRALQAAALKTWGGKTENIEAAKTSFNHRLHMNGSAATGQWTDELEKKAA